MMSVVGIECERERNEITHRSGDFIMLVDGRPNANPERNITEYEENHASSKAACFRSYPPQSGYECVDGEKLIRCVSVITLGPQGYRVN